MADGINAIANLLGKVNANNALVVTLDGGSASATTFVGPAADNTAAPPFTFTGDLNTGIASSAADTLNVVTGGTSRVAISTTALIAGVTGQFTTLGVGTTAPVAGIATNNNVDAIGGVLVGTFISGRSSRSQLFINEADGKFRLGNNSDNASIVLDLGSAANGQVLNDALCLTELTTIANAATTDTTIQMPAGAQVLAVSVRVTVIIPTAATFTVGDSGSAARFNNAAVAVAAGSTDPGTKAGCYYNASALSVRITPNATPANNSGRVRVTIWYRTSTPPTS